MEKALFLCENSGIAVCPYRILFNVDSVDDVVLLEKDSSKLQVFSNSLNEGKCSVYALQLRSVKCC